MIDKIKTFSKIDKMSMYSKLRFNDQKYFPQSAKEVIFEIVTSSSNCEVCSSGAICLKVTFKSTLMNTANLLGRSGTIYYKTL